MKTRPTHKTRGALGWPVAVVAAAILPKCVLCVAGYAAGLLGIARIGVELCGDTPDATPWHVAWLVGSAAAILFFVACAARKFLRKLS